MQPLLDIALSFPTVVFTVLLGVCLVYFLMVLLGTAKLEIFGEGVGEHLDFGDVHHHEVGDIGGDADLDVDVDVGESHAGMLAALKLRSAPLTVVVSCIVLFSWIESMIAMQIAHGTIAQVATLVCAPILALFPTSVVIRPLARFFVPHEGTRHHHLVGQVCRIRTGHVDQGFGEAMVDDGGAGIVVRVRIGNGESLGRGDQAVIIDYDEDRQEFTVAPLDELEKRLNQ